MSLYAAEGLIIAALLPLQADFPTLRHVGSLALISGETGLADRLDGVFVWAGEGEAIGPASASRVVELQTWNVLIAVEYDRDPNAASNTALDRLGNLSVAILKKLQYLEPKGANLRLEYEKRERVSYSQGYAEVNLVFSGKVIKQW